MTERQVRIYPPSELQCVADEDTGNLGSGSFGTVRLAFHNALGAVAIKCFAMGGDNPEDKIKRELDTLNKINHANVLRIFGWSKWKRSMGIIMEYLPGGSMGDLLLNEKANLDPCLRLRIGFEVADGLAFLHNLYSTRKLTHGDMKPDNVVLTRDLHCKIADFGGAEISTCSVAPKNANSSEDCEFTIPYAAPERLKNPFLKLHPQQDVYSYGIILHMVLTRENPVQMHVVANVDAFVRAVCRGARPDLDEVDNLKRDLKTKRKLGDVKLIEALEIEMKKCWDGNPTKRPNMVQVRDELSKMIDDLDFTNVLLSVADTLRGMALIHPKIDKKQCVPLSRLNPPDFVFDIQPKAEPLTPPISQSNEFPLVQAPIATNKNDEPVKPEPHADPISQSYVVNAVPAPKANKEKNKPVKAEPLKTPVIPLNQVTAVQAPVIGKQKDPAQKVRTDVVMICVLLRVNDLKKSAKVCDRLVNYLKEVKINPESCKDVVCSLVEVAGKLTQKHQNRPALHMLRTASRICFDIEDPDTKLRSLISIGSTIEDLVIILYKQDMEPGIKSVAIPLLQALLMSVKTASHGTTGIYAQASSYCLFYLGRCHVYVKEYDEAINALTQAIKIRIDTFGENAAKLSAFGQCYVMLANAEKSNGNIVEAENSLKIAIVSFQTAEDISEATKRDVIRGLEESIKKISSAPNMEALTALLMLM